MSVFFKLSNANSWLFILLLITLSFSMNAQETKSRNNQENDSLESPSKGFNKGYIVLRESGDTVKGLLKWHVFMGNLPEWVDFKIDDHHEKSHTAQIPL